MIPYIAQYCPLNKDKNIYLTLNVILKKIKRCILTADRPQECLPHSLEDNKIWVFQHCTNNPRTNLQTYSYVLTVPFVCDLYAQKSKCKTTIFPSEAGKRSYFSGATQHFCSCHCCRLFCGFRGEAGGERWVGGEWLMSGCRRRVNTHTIAILSGRWETRVHPHRHTHACACAHTHTHTWSMQTHTYLDAHYTQTVFEGRFNHGDTHLKAVVAAWPWLWPSLDARRDEQSEHWHTSRRHVNSNQRCLSVNASRSLQTDATATLPL